MTTRGWSRHEGRAVALPMENVDTDQIIPARFMSTPRAEGYGRFLFHDLRRDGAGELRADLAINAHPDASVLVAGANFGCGSSREAAVYALVDAGFRAIIAPSFADIFAANAVNNGLLPAQVPAEVVARIMRTLGAGSAPAVLDIPARRLSVGAVEADFLLDDLRAEKLMRGWDDIDLTRAEAEAIVAFREARRQAAPWAWPDAG